MTYKELFEEQCLKKSPTTTNPEQLRMGIVVEHEHKPTYEWIKNYLSKNGELPPAVDMYKHIALDHLAEIQQYYTGLAEMEKKYKK
jgi:hypothetical protein